MTEDAEESDSNGDSDLQDKEIKDQDGGNVSSVKTEENNWQKNQGNGELQCCFILHNFSPFMFSI